MTKCKGPWEGVEGSNFGPADTVADAVSSRHICDLWDLGGRGGGLRLALI